MRYLDLLKAFKGTLISCRSIRFNSLKIRVYPFTSRFCSSTTSFSTLFFDIPDTMVIPITIFYPRLHPGSKISGSMENLDNIVNDLLSEEEKMQIESSLEFNDGTDYLVHIPQSTIKLENISLCTKQTNQILANMKKSNPILLGVINSTPLFRLLEEQGAEEESSWCGPFWKQHRKPEENCEMGKKWK